MGINIGIISVRGPDYRPTRRLSEAALKRGHSISVIHPYRLWPALYGGNAEFIETAPEKKTHVVLPRQGADVGNSCLALVHHFSFLGIPVINDFDAVRLSRNQFYTLQALTTAGIRVPETVFINSAAGIAPAVDKLGGYPVVIKQVSGRQGAGIILSTSAQQAVNIVDEHLEARRGLLLQQYLPPEGRQDLRLLVIGEKVAGAMELEPLPGDFRANYHLTGNSRKITISPQLETMALTAAKSMGLEIAGVDVIVTAEGDTYVIEMNYTPGFRGLETATGSDIAGMIVDYAVERYRNRMKNLPL